MGEADEWQQRAIKMFAGKPVILLNPRRKVWEPTWEQSKNNSLLREQITWELEALEQARFIIMYFDPATKSPISLLELGKFGKKCIVVCPEGYWRKANVDIFCERYEILQKNTLEEAVESITRILEL